MHILKSKNNDLMQLYNKIVFLTRKNLLNMMTQEQKKKISDLVQKTPF